MRNIDEYGHHCTQVLKSIRPHPPVGQQPRSTVLYVVHPSRRVAVCSFSSSTAQVFLLVQVRMACNVRSRLAPGCCKRGCWPRQRQTRARAAGYESGMDAWSHCEARPHTCGGLLLHSTEFPSDPLETRYCCGIGSRRVAQYLRVQSCVCSVNPEPNSS